MKEKSLDASYDDLFSQALETFQNGEVERSEDICSGILKEHPGHGNTLNLLGVIHLKLKAPEKAYEFIQKAIENHPQKAPIFSCNLALILIGMGKIQQAAATYKNASTIFLERGEQGEALQCLQKAALLLRDFGDLVEAKRFFLDIIEIDPVNIDAHNDFGVILQKENNLEGAKFCFQSVLDLDPNYSTAYNNLGLIMYLQKKYKEAVPLLEKTLEIDPLCVEAYINLSNVFLDEDELEKALSYCEKGLKISQNHPGIYNNLGIISHREGKLDEAVSYYGKAIELNPSYEQAKNHLALVLQDINDIDSSV